MMDEQARDAQPLRLDVTFRNRTYGQCERANVSVPWLVGLIATSNLSIALLVAALFGGVFTPDRIPAAAAASGTSRAGGGAAPDWESVALGPTTNRSNVKKADRHPAKDSTASPLVERDEAPIPIEPEGGGDVPFVHVSLSLADRVAAIVEDRPPAPPAGRARAEAAPTIVRELLDDTDLLNDLRLTAIDYPFSQAAFDRTVAPARDGIDDGSDEAMLAMAAGPAHDRADAPDPMRFSYVAEVPRTSLAAFMNPTVADPFATFALSSERGSWHEFKTQEPSAGAGPVDGLLMTAAHGGLDEGDILAYFSRSGGTASLDAARSLDDLGWEGGEGFLSPDGPGGDFDGFVDGGIDAPAAALPGEAAGAPDLTIRHAVQSAAAAHGLSPDLTTHLIQVLSSEYDFDAPLGPADRLDLFLSRPGEDGRATASSELFFIRATFEGSYRAFYRYMDQDGIVAYFGPEGRGFQPVLLGSPVGDADLVSGFGMRRHPILGYDRMHEGVDWAAPEGTPILAAAGGVVEAAGWKGSFGLHTVIRHENGYVTSYSHQRDIAEGIAPGARVRQGEIIGFVGGTGLTTGSHLHFEVEVGGVTVDPMRIRAPESAALKGPALDAFLAERDRIDTLLYSEVDGVLDLASVR